MKKNKKGIFLSTAESLLDLVGANNFSQVINCFSRVRFYVNNQSDVQLEEIKNLELVKGVNWNGAELQVIIGPNASKVRQQIEILKENNVSFQLKKAQINSSKTKQSWWQCFVGAANGIIVPVLPLLISAGIINGLASILEAAGVIVSTVPDHQFITDMDWFSGLMYILTKSGMPLISIFFCYSTVKYLKGDGVIGVFLGIMIASRFFITEFVDGDFKLGSWELFKIGDLSISIKSYNNSIIPAVGIGIFYVYLDRFIKKWMPGQIDLVFRPLLAILITFFISFLFLLPILGVIEDGIVKAASWFYEIPYGIGGFIIGFLYEPFILIGVAWPVAFAIDAPYFNGTGPVRVGEIMDGSALILIGAMLAMYLKQTNPKEKNQKVMLMGPLLFGVPEPTVYGVLVQNQKVFWLSNLGSGIMGMLMSIFDVHRAEIGGLGIVNIIGHQLDYYNLGLYFLFVLVGFSINFLLIFFLWNEKVNETKLVKQTIKSISNYVWFKERKEQNKKLEFNKKILKKELEDILIASTNDHFFNKNAYKIYASFQKLANQLQVKTKKNEAKKTKIMLKIESGKDKQNLLKNKLVLLETNQLQLQEKVETKKQELHLLLEDLTIENTKLFNKAQILLDDFFKKYSITNFQQEFENKLWNSLNNTLIMNGILELKDDQISKADFYQTDNKWLLKFLPNN